MEKEELHKKLDNFLAGNNKESVDGELFSLLVRMDECRKKACPPNKERTSTITLFVQIKSNSLLI